ncbi:Hypothetical protein UVM_LOCUS18 [uncultured virus]|nr:Hypothetical protein UVM_LOCUS18 [uncultured virus]
MDAWTTAARRSLPTQFVRADISTYDQLMDIVLEEPTRRSPRNVATEAETPSDRLRRLVLADKPLAEDEPASDKPEAWQFAASDGALSVMISSGVDDGRYDVYARYDTLKRIDAVLISFEARPARVPPHEYRPLGEISMDTGQVLFTGVAATADPQPLYAGAAVVIPAPRSRDGHLVAARFAGPRRAPFTMLGKMNRLLVLLGDGTQEQLPPRFLPVGRVTTPRGALLIADPAYVLPQL